ncbi:MAG: 16S rRNA (cytosine(1402)-N(4))-methyltransferase RsmH [Spirulinaceae cyanobacterium SM2_1_0]|nr:16S rRNA (cytosine(1402)-N(4))-methyltransferase RsmH [Spirulinaceae cyanobacterium SM2_1_0]
MTALHHIPVLSQPLLAGLAVRPGGWYLDATVGGGGHSEQILAAADVHLVAIDRDADALTAARARLGSDRVTYWHGNFADYEPPSGVKFAGAIADLGVNSSQLDRAERGFSFQQTAPLDMRLDLRQDLTAAEIVNHWDEKALADLIYQYGEERLSRRIARRIVSQRPFGTTTALAGAIAAAVPATYRHGRIHPATRSFQALRIAVNGELAALDRFLARAPDWLQAGGKLGIISFHSLEDRRVKYAFRDDDRLQVLTKKPLVAAETEQRANPRSRSAKLRLAERCA